jgi:hypothetical protein
MNPVAAPITVGSFHFDSRSLNPQTMRCFRVDDWSRLPAVTVEIRQHGTYIRTARVEAVTPDSRMLWLSPEGVESRVLIDKLDGYEV